MSFGKKLKTLRVYNQLDQIKMSQRLNVSQSVYSRYENDEKEVKETDEFVKRVAEEFDVTKSWLLTENDNSFLLGKNSSPAGTYPTGQIDNYYNLPKDFMDAYFKQQQQMLEMILNKLGG